jgi:hypothetical protein
MKETEATSPQRSLGSEPVLEGFERPSGRGFKFENLISP